MSMYAAGGAAIGVVVPIGIEYFAQGKRLGATEEEPTRGMKWSAVAGIALGAIGIGAAVYDEQTGNLGLADEHRALIGAMGGGALATGVSIAVLDQLRKQGAYTFKKQFPLTSPKGLQAPPKEELLIEI